MVQADYQLISSCKIPVTKSKKSMSLFGEQTIAFMFMVSIIIAISVSLGRTYARSIFSIFPLCRESNTLEKSTNKCYIYSFKDLMNCLESVKLWINFSENHGIIDFRNYSSKSYASQALIDSEVTFYREREDAAFSLFLCCVLFISSVE